MRVGVSWERRNISLKKIQFITDLKDFFSHCGGRRIGRLYARGTGITVVYGICPFCHIGQHQYVTGHFIYVRQPIFHIGRFVYVIGVVKVQLYASVFRCYHTQDAGEAQCYSPAAFISFIKGSPTGAVAPIGVSCRQSRPTAIAHSSLIVYPLHLGDRERKLRITVAALQMQITGLRGHDRGSLAGLTASSVQVGAPRWDGGLRGRLRPCPYGRHFLVAFIQPRPLPHWERSGQPPPFRRAKSSIAPGRREATHPGVDLA